MKKMLLVSLILLSNCTYKPIIDTSGRSGTFNESKAVELTNDLQHCRTLAKENTNFVGNVVYWTLSPTADTKYEMLVRKCLNNRGHSVLN